MSSKRRRFDREFKKQAVRLASEEGQSSSQVARELGIRRSYFVAGRGSSTRKESVRFRARVALVTRTWLACVETFVG